MTHAEKALEKSARRTTARALLLVVQSNLALENTDACEVRPAGIGPREGERATAQDDVNALADAEVIAKNQDAAMKILDKGFGETKAAQFLFRKAEMQIEFGDPKEAESTSRI